MTRSIAALSLSLALLSPVRRAEAHPRLVSSTPIANGHVAAAPAEIAVTFNENITVALSKLTMLNASQQPVALDSLLSLARQVALDTGTEKPVSDRLLALLEKDSRYAEAIGPHRLVHKELSPAQAAAILPPELWQELLAILIRLFPGIGRDSFRRDFGDAPAGALETVFNEPLAALEALLVRTRSLIVIDWTANREIRSVIDSILSKAQ